MNWLLHDRDLHHETGHATDTFRRTFWKAHYFLKNCLGFTWDLYRKNNLWWRLPPYSTSWKENNYGVRVNRRAIMNSVKSIFSDNLVLTDSLYVFSYLFSRFIITLITLSETFCSILCVRIHKSSYKQKYILISGTFCRLDVEVFS